MVQVRAASLRWPPGYQVGPGPSAGESQDPASAGGDDPARDCEQPEPEPFGFPEPGGLVTPGHELGPGEQLGGELSQFEPDLVLVEPVEREVGCAGVFQVPDAVLGAGPEPVGT